MTEWDRVVLDDMAKRYRPAAVRLLSGLTLRTYAGSVPPDWDGAVVELFDCFEMRRLERHHPDVYREGIHERSP